MTARPISGDRNLIFVVIFLPVSDDKDSMQPWLGDFSACGLDEVLRFQAENRQWSKELRRKTNDLVNSRLAKAMSQADYLEGRKLIHEAAAECRLRASILDAQIVRHTAA